MTDDRLSVELSEFGSHYASTEAGRQHIATYASQRAAGRANLQEVLARADAGEDVTDLVLLKLLPHADTAANRERGAWIHVAPTVTRDIKRWFERAGWAEPDSWPNIASAVLRFYQRVAQSPGEIESACVEFTASEWSKGIQSAFLSPMLNALNPQLFCIVNSKSRKTALAFSNTRYPLKIAAYPRTNRRLLELIEQSAPHLESSAQDALPGDVFDAFCHWFIAVRKGASSKTTGERNRAGGTPLSVGDWFEAYVPESGRTHVQRVLANAMIEAHRHGPSTWSVTARPWRIRLNAGRLGVLTIRRKGEIKFGMLQEDRASLADALSDVSPSFGEPFAADPRGTSCVIPISAAATHERDVTEAVARFIPIASSSATAAVFRRSHSSEISAYLSAELDETVPEPDFKLGSERSRRSRRTAPASPSAPPASVVLRGPRTLFRKVDYELATLLHYIAMGDVALPDIQRPFVWSATKVRDLFDSMYRGYPVGYLLFWSNSGMRRGRAIGTGEKQHLPDLLIVDGQQRLTSLYAVFRAQPVLDDDYVERRLEIAFRPRDGRFDVADAAIRRDPEYIANISDVLGVDGNSWSVTSTFLGQLEAARTLTDDDRHAISSNIDRLLGLHKYPFTALEISSEMDEQSVADVFVRINSEGVKLNQSDFILTLLSVVWPEGRKDLERFAHDCARLDTATRGASPFNHLIQVGADQLLRVVVAVGFHRARLRSVYQLLRAKELDGSPVAAEKREADLAKLREAQAAVLDLHNWHSFLNAITAAGYRSSDMISSNTALVYSYALYLIGKRQCGVPDRILQRLIARWFVGSVLTGRYTGSSETIMEDDLSAVSGLSSAETFVELLESRLRSLLTNDFWETTLPIELETSSRRSPAALAFTAAQVRLGAHVLFSDKSVAQLLDPSLRRVRTPTDRHHLFPRRYLEKAGVTQRKLVNQFANMALVEWPDNISIGAKAPADYVSVIKPQFSSQAWDAMSRAHALPPDWYKLPYGEFLRQRRPLMAATIRRSYDSLTGNDDPPVEKNASAEEQEVWELLRDTERRLRRVVRRKYQERFGAGATARMESVLGADAMAGVNRARAKRASQMGGGGRGDELLDYTYLGQLITLMLSSELWEMIKPAFRDKRELEDLARPITKVRNEAAHFRHVPSTDLRRCRVAVDDLAERIQRLEAPALD